MDFFQRSSPPNFISFCLANQTEDEFQTQTNTTTDIPIEPAPAPTSVSESNVVRGPLPSPPPFLQQGHLDR